MPVDQMSVDQMSFGQMSVDQMSFGQMSVDQMSVGQLVFDKKTWKRTGHFQKEAESRDRHFRTGGLSYKTFYSRNKLECLVTLSHFHPSLIFARKSSSRLLERSPVRALVSIFKKQSFLVITDGGGE